LKYIKFQLANMLILVLENYDLQILKIQYMYNSITIYAFHYKEHKNFLFKRILKINKFTFNKLYVRKFYGLHSIF